MKHLLISALFLLPAAARAQDATIEDVITDQLQAFVDRDIASASEHASPMIPGMFGTPENFGMMLRNGYPMVWDNSVVRFLVRTEF